MTRLASKPWSLFWCGVMVAIYALFLSIAPELGFVAHGRVVACKLIGQVAAATAICLFIAAIIKAILTLQPKEQQ